MNTKYNYVFFALDKDYYRVAYHDIENCSWAQIKWSGSEFNSVFLNTMHKLHYSSTINKYISLPLKRIWFPLISSNKFKNNKPLCFVFFGREAAKYGPKLMRYLKKKYSGSKIIITFLDLIKTTMSDEQFTELGRCTDLMFTYDFGDAHKYKMLYQHDVFSRYPIEDNPDIPKCDVYFLGKAKDRLKDIIQCYDMFTEKGLQCDFYITGVSDGNRITRPDIHYLNSNMTYYENLQHVHSANALLEIIQGGAKGSTLRCCEAIAYGKFLITNNAGILNEPFYRENTAFFFDSINELKSIEANKIKQAVDFDYIEKISPLSFIERLESLL
ncbi:MAG: hypothetical protein K6F97_12715 [Lachnospiraceae bacterium]|nr:hypothetical protein [Lachnospiraceae bacterium]